jgi:hypothetical protein
MAARKPRPARVSVDYHQYQVAAGPDIDVGDDRIPGLLGDLGPQAVVVITGLQWGKITVTAAAVPMAPTELDPGWDVIAETDLECPEGVIAVSDWAGPDHPELGELAIAGPGRYRLRVHARNRQAGEERSREEHHLVIWPATEPAPPRLLTPMDAYGREFTGKDDPEGPALDALDLAAAAGVRHLADLVNQPDPPQLTSELAVVHAKASVSGTPRKVWNEVSKPWLWLGNHGGEDPARFYVHLSEEPKLDVRGGLVTEEPLTNLAFTWSWTAKRYVEVESPMVVSHVMRQDLATGEITSVAITDPTRTVKSREPVDSWMLPSEPTTVHIRLRRHGKGTTAVELEHRDLPVELADDVRPFWEWALQRGLPQRFTKAPFYGFPWDR